MEFKLCGVSFGVGLAQGQLGENFLGNFSNFKTHACNKRVCKYRDTLTFHVTEEITVA